MLGVDPIADYTPVLEQAGLTIDVYEETPGWANGVYPTFSELIGASDARNGKMGERAAAGTLRSNAHRRRAALLRRVHIVARRPD